MYNNSRRERSVFLPMLAIGMGMTSLFSVGRAVGAAMEHTEDRIKEAQLYNAQLQDQLVAEYPNLDGLVLTNGDDKTFTFYLPAENGVAETCRGDYEVKAEHATAIGSIACTQTRKIS